MYYQVLVLCFIKLSVGAKVPAVDYVDRNPDGSYKFAYATGDEGNHYHTAVASPANVVAGKFGSKDPGTGQDLQTTYTAGPRGFRARGPHIARIMDLSQNKPPFSRPNNDGKYDPALDNIFDPNEDPSYSFSVKTKDYVKDERADSKGDVTGRYTYLDDTGARHDVEYIAGSRTGFVVTNSVPDTVAQAQADPLFFQGNGPGPKIRGHSSIQKALDGSYSFIASGPDQKRTEVSDALGNRRGSYTYLDDKGQQHTVQYIAGANIGYKIINDNKGPIFPPGLPYFPPVSSLAPPVSAGPSILPGTSGSTKYPGTSSGFPSSTASYPSSLGSSSVGLPDFAGNTDSSSGFLSPSPGYPSSTPATGVGSSTSTPLGSSHSSEKPQFPPTLGPSLGSSTSSYGPTLTEEKWPDLGSNDFLTDPLFADFPNLNDKDWSNKNKGSGNKGSGPSSSGVFAMQPYFPITNKHRIPVENYDPTVDIGNQDHSFHDFDFLHHQLFPDGLRTAETGAGLANNFRKKQGGKVPLNGKEISKDGQDSTKKNKNDFLAPEYDDRDKRPTNDELDDHWDRRPNNDHRDDHSDIRPNNDHRNNHKDWIPSNGYRDDDRNWRQSNNKYGGSKKPLYPIIEDRFGHFRITPGVAVRALVQNLDIIPSEKRYVSPGEALEMYNRLGKRH